MKCHYLARRRDLVHWHNELEWPTVLAILQRKVLGIGGVTEKDDLLVQDIYVVMLFGNLCRDEAYKVNLDAGILEAR